MNEQDKIGFIKKCYAAYVQGDGETLLSYMAPDIDWNLPEMPDLAFSGKRHGKAQVAEFFQLVAASQQLRSFEPREFFANGDRVLVLGHHDWTVRASGRDFGSDWVHIFTVRDGLVASFQEMTDTMLVVDAYHQEAAAGMQPPSDDTSRQLLH